MLKIQATKKKRVFSKVINHPCKDTLKKLKDATE